MLLPLYPRAVRAADSTEARPVDSGPIRLSSPAREERLRRDDLVAEPIKPPVPPLPSEFETYVQGLAGSSSVVRRFGADLLTVDRTRPDSDTVAEIPSDYVIGAGDEVHLTIWGSVDADLRLVVDRSGRIAIPRVGQVLVAGVKQAELTSLLEQRLGQVFRNFKLSASLGKVRSIRIYVTGFAAKPGSYTVSALSTLVNAAMKAGGPSSAGSLRSIELRRAGKLVTGFDLYDLLVRGDKSADRVLQAEDVVYFGPIGEQVAVIGSVNTAAIFELKPGETVADVIGMAGGFSAVADRQRVLIERLQSRNDVRIVELKLPAGAKERPHAGDVMRAVSAVSAVLPQERQNKRVRVEGEVRRPGEYILAPNTSLADALAAAGGLTAGAYVFGTELNRESVRVQQEANYDRALRDLETEFTRSATTQKSATGEEAAVQAARAQSTSKLIERLRAVKPSGRIVLQLTPSASSLPDIATEDGDRILVPARPTTIGVFGSVFNGGSFLFGKGGTLKDYLQLAGGPTRGADVRSMFVLRANGSVLSARQSSGWLMASNGLATATAEPGDTLFVPEEINKTTLGQDAREWTQILYQLGLGAAGLKVLKN